MKEFKIRCSQIGQIMTNPKSKTELLSETTKKYVDLWMKEQLYGRKKEVNSKYMTKGIQQEDASIDLLAENDSQMYIKNQQFFSDEFVNGTPDIILKDKIIDIKTVWDFSTMPIFDEALKNKDYEWQLLGYMYLTGIKKAEVAYVLSDTPIHLMESEAKSLVYKQGYDFQDAYEMIEKKMTYSDVPIKYRIKRFEVEYSEEKIQQVIERVKEIREYIKQIKL